MLLSLPVLPSTKTTNALSCYRVIRKWIQLNYLNQPGYDPSNQFAPRSCWVVNVLYNSARLSLWSENLLTAPSVRHPFRPMEWVLKRPGGTIGVVGARAPLFNSSPLSR